VTLICWFPGPHVGTGLLRVPVGGNIHITKASVRDMKLTRCAILALILWVPFGNTARGQPTEVITLPGGQLNVTVAPTIRAAEQTKIIQWLTSSGNAVTTAYGVFPLASVDVIVIPANRGDGPVPFGQVVREDSTRVKLLINPTEPLVAFVKDWTAVHEFAHLMLPYINRDAAWLSEGIATYYQYVMRVRAGLISEREAWLGILAGLERGRNDTHSSQTLHQTCRDMSRQGGFMRVYWSGLVYALTTDVRLRESGDGEQSLDRALLEFHRCCLPADREWSAVEFVNRLDQLSATDEFTNGYRDYPDRRDFPAIEATLASLGVVYLNSQLQLDDMAPNAAIRHKIMAP